MASPATRPGAPGPRRSAKVVNEKDKQFQRDLLVKLGGDSKKRRDTDLAEENLKKKGDSASGSPADLPPLVVDATEFYLSRNAKVHHTTEYQALIAGEFPIPVLRRGQPFCIAIRLDRPFDLKNDVLRLSWEFGPRPSVPKNTKAILKLTEETGSDPFKDNASWQLRFQGQSGSNVSLEVQIPSTAPVGIWKLKLITNRRGRGEPKNEYDVQEEFYVLFNPWCKEDTVYMEDEKLRKEYVLNDSGKVWCGSFRAPKGRRWVFGQFEEVSLPASVFLLEKANVPYFERGNPIKLVRAISAVINSEDDDGLLVGRWDNDYGDGTAPNAWTGSVAIFEKYLSEGGTPVKYGQCWVFSAVTVTVCRALGIPCRSVTNYVSAHDTNSTLTIDKFFDKFGEEIPLGPDGDCSDSCWNFHVWNDVWMMRPDLPTGYGGWQIIDATPQELSDSVYCCGPASAEAVRRGEVGFLYDTPFVFAEVNADICHFKEDDESDWGFSRIALNRYHVGRKMLTKSPDADDDHGDSDMVDITHEYKDKEGSPAERLAVFNAVKGVPRTQQLYDLPGTQNNDVEMDLIEIDTVPYGDDFDVTVKIHNKSSENRTITMILSASTVFYTGTTAHLLKKAQKTFAVKPNGKETLSLHLRVDDYLAHLVDQGFFKIYAIASVVETKQTWSEEDDFHLTKPNLTVKLNGDTVVGKPCELIFVFKNPLKIDLTNCKFRVEGPGLQRPKVLPFRNVGGKEEVSISEWFVPKRVGKRKIVGSFYSDQINDVAGAISVIVHE